MGHDWGLDYVRWAKGLFLFGFGLIALGVMLAGIGPLVFETLPEWTDTLAVDMIAAGIGIDFVAVFGFGIALPLTE
ncbi:hypothetical protein AB7C87_15560 [Natrarchaeobius sp. A-rgal3]|uniref:DUF7860 family protein n=1 Tax=Natrarchaeobius versutus TaxID=1679078 RepID=UPI00350FB436